MPDDRILDTGYRLPDAKGPIDLPLIRASERAIGNRQYATQVVVAN
jgi:hypothetical protein